MAISKLQIVCILLFRFYSLLSVSLSKSVHFNIPRFVDSATNILYSGDAVASDGAIEFNILNYENRVGHAKYAEAVLHIWDKKSRKLSEFTTHFTFVIDTLDEPSSYGHGFSFFLAPVGFQIPPNSVAGFLGLFNLTYLDSPVNQMIVVEFDSYKNKNWDPPFEHVGININSIRSVNYTAWNASLHSGDPADVWVSYNGTTRILNLSWSYVSENTSQENNNLSYQVDLRDVLPEWVTIGFSAATGCNIERNILQYWEFNSTLDIVDESDNIAKSKKTKLVGSIAVPLVVLFIGGVVACVIFKWRRRKPTQSSLETASLTSINEELVRGVGPKRFSFKHLASATKNFSDNQKLGEGGFGCVYKGYLLKEGMAVAVKKISQGFKQGKKEFMTEVKVISSLRHRNLVQLIGWCHDQTQFLLVYEFLPNGSLDSHLFSKKSPLDWGVRYKIATGLASALLYLHEECELCVLHRDIKTSNIVLDSGFNVKLGDFGLARLMDRELGLQTTGLAGTVGYLAPEYATTGKASKESDIYGFGVVALEIVCGRKAMEQVDPTSDLGLVQWVWGLLAKGDLLSGVDRMLNREFDTKQVECLMKLGLWCTHPDRCMRPSIQQVIQVLKFDGVVSNLPMPLPIYHTTQDRRELSSASAPMTKTSIDLER